MAEESRNCLAWAAIDRSKTTATSSNDYRFLISQQAPNSIAHAFIHGTDAHIILGEMSPDHARHLVQFLAQQGVILKTIEGPWQVAEEFSVHWNRSTNSSTTSRMNQGLYELTKVVMPDSMGGHLVQAQERHRPTLHAFVTGFLSSFPGKSVSPQAADQRVERFITEKRAYLWQQEDQTFVAMAAIVRESPNTSSISWVYTPPNFRRQGHAARVVAHLSQIQLTAGKHACNLHTDLDNSTSNKVYRRIGYKMIARSYRIKICQG